MRNRRVVCFLMGIWIGVSAMLALNVYRNFDAVEAIVKAPPEQARIFKIIGPDNARALLRYTAGVENADTFEVWEDIQFGLGILIMAVLFLASSTRILSVFPLVMTLLLVFMHLKITPELAWLGRTIEFAPLAETVTRDQFWRLHRIYGILEIVKCMLGMGLTVFLVMQRSAKVVRRRHRREPETAGEFNREATPL